MPLFLRKSHWFRDFQRLYNNKQLEYSLSMACPGGPMAFIFSYSFKALP